MELLDVMEAMGAHFHEHHDDICAWSWRLFCAKWARMTVQLAQQERARREREREQEHERRLEAMRARQL